MNTQFLKLVILFVVILLTNKILLATPINTFIESVAPNQNAINVNKSSDISVIFSQNMNETTINDFNIKVFGVQTGKLSSSISYNSETETATISPNNDFKVGERIQVTLSSGIQTSSNTPITPFTWTFTVQALSGTSVFTEVPVETSGINIRSFVSGDFDNDGDLDIITLNTNGNYFLVYKNDQHANFTKTSSVPLNVSPKSIIEGDFDGDGDLDIAIAGSNVLYIYKNIGNAVFSQDSYLQIISGVNLTNVAEAKDLDNDGDIDLLWGGLRSSFSYSPLEGLVFLNNGYGSFNYLNSIVFDVGWSPCTGGQYLGNIKEIDIIDFDDDGDLDVAASVLQERICIGYHDVYPFIRILFNNGNSQFSSPLTISLDSLRPLTTGDFDNDEDADIISNNLLLRNNNTGSFTSSSNNIQGVSIISSDFDADGNLDIATITNPNKLSIHKNNGNATFTQPSDFNLDINPQALESGDFDGDGAIDIAIISRSGTDISILLNASIYNIKVAIEGYYSTFTNELNKKDTMRVYLRNTSSPFDVVDSAKAVIDSVTLTGSFVFNYAPSGIYYIQLKHRNGLETWSKDGGEPFTRGLVASYDFTTAQTQAYGNNLISKGTIWCIYSGDVNQDGIIDVSDISLVYNAASNSIFGYVPEDVSGDGFVDVTDVSIVYNNNSVMEITPSGTGPQTLTNKLNTKKEINQIDQKKKEINRDDQNKNKGAKEKSF